MNANSASPPRIVGEKSKLDADAGKTGLSPPSKKMDIAPNSSPTETIDLLVRKIEQNKSDKNAFTADVFLTFDGILTNVMSELSTLKNENMTLNARLAVVENCNASKFTASIFHQL